jgi:quinol monooxygenase YgiN
MADEGQVTVVARIEASAGKEEQLREELEALIQPTRSEEGCLNYDLHRGKEDSSVFIFYENWRSQQDLDEHLEKPYLQEFVEKAEDLSENGVEITLLQMVSAPSAGTAGR